MDGNAHRFPTLRGYAPSPAGLLLGTAAVALAVDPVLWLVRTWFDPAYPTQGMWAAAAAFLLFVWSVSSKRQQGLSDLEKARNQRVAWLLLCVATAVRVAGRVLAVNALGALVLPLDMYALGRMAGLHQRTRAVAPGWLAVVAALSLPLERMLQRVVGHGMQLLSARGAESVLSLFFADIKRQGARLIIEGHNALVDLPCAGARSLSLLMLFTAILLALARPDWKRIICTWAMAMAAALAMNILRVSLLSAWVVRPGMLGIHDILAEPWHSLLGLMCLAIGCGLVLQCVSLPRNGTPRHAAAPFLPQHARGAAALSSTSGPTSTARFGLGKLFGAGALACFALAAFFLPRTPMDVSEPGDPLQLPSLISGIPGQALEMSSQETVYFSQFGGQAMKQQYGPYTVTLVRTSSPLRHLHAPDECLRGLGYTVRLIDLQQEPLPTAVYSAVAPDGSHWLVAASFISDQGRTTASVAEAVWLWLGQGGHWTSLVRMRPMAMDPAQAEAFDMALAAALDLPVHAPAHESFTQSSQIRPPYMVALP